MKTLSMKFGLLPALALLAMQVMLTPAFAGDSDGNDNPGKLSATDYRFAKEAACGGMLEVTLGNMALTNSENSSVQQFGQRMVNDHGKAGAQLAAIITQRGATLPQQVTEKQQKEINKLTGLHGGEFDRAYMAYMVRCHKMDEKLFKRASEDATDPEIKSFATTTLVTVQEHLKMGEDIDADLKRAEVSVN